MKLVNNYHLAKTGYQFDPLGLCFSKLTCQNKLDLYRILKDLRRKIVKVYTVILKCNMDTAYCIFVD